MHIPDSPRRHAIGRLLGIPLMAAAGVSTVCAQTPKVNEITTLNARLDAIETRQQITEVLYRYTRGWDLLDEEMIRSCFFADAEHQHSSFKGLSHDFITRALPMVAKTRSTRHAISNVMIEIRDDGDAAVSDCYFLAHHRRLNAEGSDEEDYFLGGRYLDWFEKREGVWKIARRRGLNSLERIIPRADRSFAAAAPESFTGRYPDDPMYAFLAELNR